MLNTSDAKMLLNHSLNKKITLYRLLSILIITYMIFFCGCCQNQRHYSLIYHERSQQIIRSEIHMSRTNYKSITLEHIFFRPCQFHVRFQSKRSVLPNIFILKSSKDLPNTFPLRAFSYIK